jgi:hypothetical protein
MQRETNQTDPFRWLVEVLKTENGVLFALLSIYDRQAESQNGDTLNELMH